MMELIAHTDPEANIPSKNHEANALTPSISCTGEYTKIPKKNPIHVDAHIIHLIISLTKMKNPRRNEPDVSAVLLMKFLGPLNILPYTMMLVIP
jgi:hypothetical protein